MRVFNSNSIFLFIIAGIIISFVIAQSLFFFRKAWKRAIELGVGKITLLP